MKPRPIHETHVLVKQELGYPEEAVLYPSTAAFYGDETYYRNVIGCSVKRVKRENWKGRVHILNS